MTARKSPLRAVAPDEKPARRFKNISESLEGSSRDVLAAMREALAKQLDAGAIAGNSIASAYRELRELDRLIRLADDEAEVKGAGRGDIDRTFNPAAI